jgi:hypothetical protein
MCTPAREELALSLPSDVCPAGRLCLSDLLLGPGMLLEQLQQLDELAAGQDCWHMFSASLLVVYEGSAHTAQEVRLATRLIDFAHTFPTAKFRQWQQQQDVSGGEAPVVSGDGPCGVDENLLAGLRSLIQVLRQTLDQQQQRQHQ